MLQFDLQFYEELTVAWVRTVKFISGAFFWPTGQLVLFLMNRIHLTHFRHYSEWPPSGLIKILILTHTYPQKSLRKIKVDIFNHKANYHIYAMWVICVWFSVLLPENGGMSFMTLNVLIGARRHGTAFNSTQNAFIMSLDLNMWFILPCWYFSLSSK